MSKLLRGLVLLGAVGLVMAVMALMASRSGSRGGLQRYRAELQAKGEKLTFAELTRGRQTNVTDSHALITNATAKLSGARFAPGLLEPRRYARPGQARVTWRQGSPSWAQSAGPSSRGTWEEFAAQMQAAQSALQEIREALREPALDAGPSTNMLAGRRVNFVAIRYAAQWLMGAAENDLHQGRLEAALQNVEALAALARMERDEYTLVAQMIRVAVAGLGLSVTWEALQAPGWTEPQLERLQKALEPVDLAEAVERGFVGQRACGYEIFALLRRSRGPQIGRLLRSTWNLGSSSPTPALADVLVDFLYMPAYKLTSIDEDELFHLRTAQQSITALQLLKAHRPWAEAKELMNQVTTNVDSIAHSPRRIYYFVSMMSTPNYLKASGTAVRAETERQLTLAAIALKRFQLRHGKLPLSLDAMVPEFLTAVPYDYMSARSLCYRLKDDGSYVLYSVGEDGKDDGGDPTPLTARPSGLWTGRDAVWPSPATEPDDAAPQPGK